MAIVYILQNTLFKNHWRNDTRDLHGKESFEAVCYGFSKIASLANVKDGQPGLLTYSHYIDSNSSFEIRPSILWNVFLWGKNTEPIMAETLAYRAKKALKLLAGRKRAVYSLLIPPEHLSNLKVYILKNVRNPENFMDVITEESGYVFQGYMSAHLRLVLRAKILNTQEGVDIYNALSNFGIGSSTQCVGMIEE